MRWTQLFSVVPATFALLAFTSTASAAECPDKSGIAACGCIDVSAEGQCKVEVEGGCTAKCTPFSFEAACEAKFDASKCSGQCTGTAEASCTGSCQSDCEAKCNVKPAEFDCQGSCKASCEGDCDAQCAAKSSDGQAQSECKASCKGSCTSSCSGSCTGQKPEADCKAKCEGSCKGSCTAKVNVDCNVDCSKAATGQCFASAKGGCEAACSKPEGALFCDGKYVDSGNNLQDCVGALNAFLKTHVDASATGSASCSGGSCKAEGEAGASCGTIEPRGRKDVVGLGAMGLLLGVGLLASRRSKRA